MKDISGKEVKVGDPVAFGLGGTMRLHRGVITKVCNKTVLIQGKETSTSSWTTSDSWRRDPKDIVILGE